MTTTQNLFTATLLDWFTQNGRDLPWRHTRDPYAIWLSEVILQQTRIVQGTNYWLRFMRRWPRVTDLAAASEDDVMRMWQGLGYYSRARNLHTAAKQIAQRGAFPTTIKEIKQLKGVGDYTAAAIGSIAFGLPVASVDGNFYRVLSRYFGINTPINTTEGQRLFASLAQELLPPSAPADYNQAVMDFGAMVCTPASPQCTACPLSESCVALRDGKVATLPIKLKKVTVKERHLELYYIRHEGQIALHKRGRGDIWQGLWCVPEAEHVTDDWKKRAVLIRKNVKHVLTHRVLWTDFYLLDTAERPPLPDDFLWIKQQDIDNYGIPRLVELLLEAVSSTSSSANDASDVSPTPCR